MTGATCCSGIGSPEVAMPWVDWKWCAEVEKFPCAVLAARNPNSVNLGDITAPDFIERAQSMGSIDLLVAGTPCQAFSVAGNRKSLDDERGNLTLRFVEIVDAIQPRFILWENVHGVLSTKDNAFGCFLGSLAGAGAPLVPARGQRWTNFGVVDGPVRRIAWRIQCAQWHGVAQRRERVFVVASLRDGPHPCEILLEREGVQRHTAPSRKTREEITGDAGSGAAASSERGGYEISPALSASGRGTERAGESRGQDCVVAVNNTGQGYWTEDEVTTPVRKGNVNGNGEARISTQSSHLVASTGDLSHCLNAGGMGRSDYETETLVTDAVAFKASHFTRGKDGSPRDTVPPLSADADKGDQDTLVFAPRFMVRRLLPVECARLQAFPDGHLDIDFNGKPASDSVKYKALGNSMCVNVIRWIGDRLKKYA